MANYLINYASIKIPKVQGSESFQVGECMKVRVCLKRICKLCVPCPISFPIYLFHPAGPEFHPFIINWQSSK